MSRPSVRPSMRDAAAGLAIAAALAVAACTSDDPGPTEQTPPQTATVQASATANVFSPGTATVARGGTVTWTFGARPHNVIFRAAAGAPENVPTTTDAQVSRQFSTAGTFGYDCQLHDGMSGTIVVR